MRSKKALRNKLYVWEQAMGIKIITITVRIIKSLSNREAIKIITISHQLIIVNYLILLVPFIHNNVKMVSIAILPDLQLEKPYL